MAQAGQVAAGRQPGQTHPREVDRALVDRVAPLPVREERAVEGEQVLELEAVALESPQPPPLQAVSAGGPWDRAALEGELVVWTTASSPR